MSDRPDADGGQPTAEGPGASRTSPTEGRVVLPARLPAVLGGGREVPALGFGLGLAAVILVLDQITKILVLTGFGRDLFTRPPSFLPGPSVDLSPIFDLTLVWNRGVSFGLFAADTLLEKYLLVGFALAIVTFMVLWLRKADRFLVALAIGLIIGGAVGNVIDRVFYAAVVDFLDFSGLGFPWVFNVADSAISIAVALIVADLVITEVETRRAARAEGRTARAESEKPGR